MALGAALLMVNGLFLKNGFARFFAHPFWYPMARVSYGIYLTHTYVMFSVLKVVGYSDAVTFGTWQFFALFVAVMFCTTLVATVLFLFFEAPMIELGRKWSRRFKQPKLETAGERAALAAEA